MICRISGATIAAALLVFGMGSTGEAGAGEQSFRNSCTNIRISQENGQRVIYADCDDGRSTAQFDGFHELRNRLVIPSTGCADVSNQNGTLRCIGSEHPSGSWSQSCIEGRFIRGRVFQAVCAPYGTRDPSVYSSIDMNSCRDFRLENINGHLRCS